jgi:hypothetical protein
VWKRAGFFEDGDDLEATQEGGLEVWSGRPTDADREVEARGEDGCSARVVD